MHATQPSVQWRAPFFGAKTEAEFLRQMSDDDYYPFDDDTEGERPKTSIRLPKQLHADIAFIAELWNEFDRVTGKKRGKWLPHRVMEQFIAVGRNKVAQAIDGLPADEKGRKEYLRQAKQKFDAMVAQRESASAAKSKK